jgi:hypothetical protein
MVDEVTIERRFKLIERYLDERMRRLVAAAEAEAAGFGGVSVVARATGVSRRAIRIGARELKESSRGSSPPQPANSAPRRGAEKDGHAGSDLAARLGEAD